MVRSLASENLEISEVDDFMHRPKSRVPFHGTETSVSPPPDKYWCSSQPITSDGSSGMYPSSQNQFNHRLTHRYVLLMFWLSFGWFGGCSRYGHRHFDPLQGTQSDLSSVKYCGGGSDEYDSSGKSQQAQVGNLKLELPLDEDDYLMPSPQHNKQGTSTYLDLKNATEHVSNPNLFPPNYSELFQNNIDNPEYLMSNEPIPQTVGLPDVSEFIVPPSPGTSEPPNVPPKSSEEESDHECYNEFDRLRREMQPLQKDPSIV